MNDLRHTDPLKADTDSDGMARRLRGHVRLPQPAGQADANADPDGDGYTNIQEMGMGTNPCVFNCDMKYDWNKDSYVTFADVAMMINSWNAKPGDANWVAAYDVDGDGADHRD